MHTTHLRALSRDEMKIAERALIQHNGLKQLDSLTNSGRIPGGPPAELLRSHHDVEIRITFNVGEQDSAKGFVG